MSLTDNIGCCGMDCGACEARKATAANDTEALARIASSLESEDENPFILPSKVKCTGCLAPGVKSLSSIHNSCILYSLSCVFSTHTFSVKS